jgi:hypothetical protein
MTAAGVAMVAGVYEHHHHHLDHLFDASKTGDTPADDEGHEKRSKRCGKSLATSLGPWVL